MSDSANDDDGGSSGGGGDIGRRRESRTSHNPSDGEEEPPRLSDLLRDGWEAFEEADACGAADGGGGGASSASASSPLAAVLRLKVRRGMASLEEASRMASRLGLFSGNEALDEVATADLQYLLLPALQGALAMKLDGGGGTPPSTDGGGDESRLEAVRGARVHFYAFLRRCRDYGVATFPMPRRRTGAEEEEEEEEEEDSSRDAGEIPVAATAAQRRQAKVERYRQRKETEARIAAMRAAVESGRADDGDVRDFHLLQARRWVALALEEVESIDREMPLLLEKKNRSAAAAPGARSSECDGPRPLPADRPVVRPHPGGVGSGPANGPFILARGAAQARVFGAGYPSQPSMTVDDWYEQHVASGALPDRGVARRHRSEAEAGEDEEEEEEAGKKQKDEDEDEDDEALQKARDWDEWKDCHPRGYGNRQNRS